MSADDLAAVSPKQQLFAQFSQEAGNGDVSGLSPGDIEALAGTLWAFVEAGGHDEGAQVRVRLAMGEGGRKMGRSVLEAVGPDMPFLVDSLLNECSAQGLEVLTLFHPILELDDGRRLSTIQIHLPLLAEAETEDLAAGARATLSDVALAVSDFHAMREAMSDEIQRLAGEKHIDETRRQDGVDFLEWLESEHFVFLGKRTYEFVRDSEGNVLPEEPEMVEGSNLGLLRNEDLNVLNRSSEPTVLTPEIGAFLQRPDPLIIAKSTMVSRVHRRVNADYVGIKHYDEAGRVSGETRFLGLFTADAYDETARSIPLIRRRVREVIEASGANRGGHSEKALANLLETWPRDELLQTDSETLTPMLLSALHLIGRPRTRLFLRFDEFDRFVTAIVFVPREAYDTQLRVRITRILEEAFDGEVTDFKPRFDSGPLARVTYHVRLSAGHPVPDSAALEAEIAAAARTWDEAFREAIAHSGLDEDAAAGALCFRGAFNAAYREAFEPSEAIEDVRQIARLSDTWPVRLRAYRLDDDGDHVIRAKIYTRKGSIPLSQCVPVFEHMGLFVEFETGYPVRPHEKPVEDAPDTYWVHSLSMRTRDGTAFGIDAISTKFEEAFVAIWRGRAEDDGFNRLVLTAGASWHEAALIRALAAYRKQSGMDPERLTQIEALNAHPGLTRAILDLFAARFDPGLDMDLEARQARCEDIRAEIEAELENVAALDDDRVIRRIADLVMALQRTNFYQTTADGGRRGSVSFKIASGEVEELPDPKPYREIFMASPRVEGVHCRFGPVARGGIRWSDRRDDFRTEVLGLVKAQQVKNAVIVPVGSKGGFFPKQLPAQGTREAVRDAGIAAYRQFITSLLDLTDNLIDGEVRPPDDTVVWDADDPYLVVAADKGTATFSDIANEISEAHGFWLGDAFASGGSAGYDHKKMGITARGAWEAVKRHFREKGKDIQSEPFTVIGIGDMGGDVFGNGMLLSKQIRLIAAFNHLHVFVDPEPGDPERLWQERKRLFDLPRSSWADYDTRLISEGGGIFERSAKSITLTPQIKALASLSADRVTPNELIHALLKADAELLWFGGIGTYVKSREESHGDVGDRANDAIRVDGRELGVEVIGEGANLGMTQAARIEFALAGGRVNSDAIDNSAGVDSSDHEVNIKILASEAIRRGALARGERNTLLAEMTEDVAAHVLQHNYAQTGALSLARHLAIQDHDALERAMVELEALGVLDRVLEGLPDTAEMHRRRDNREPLTRPELAVILAWSKITLFDDIVASDLPDDPAFERTLAAYFPPAIREYGEAMQAHRLKREIIATVLANRILDTGGPAFLLRLREATNHDNACVTRAFEVARVLLSMEEFETALGALDTKVPEDVLTGMRADAMRALSGASEYFCAHHLHDGLGEVIARYRDPLDRFKASLRETASSHAAARIERRARALMASDVPEPLARWCAAIGYFAQGIALVPVAEETCRPMPEVAGACFAIGDQLRLDRLRASAEEAIVEADYWDRVATRRLIDDLLTQQFEATRLALHEGGVETWMARRETHRLELTDRLQQLSAGHSWSFSRFTLAADAVRRFMHAEI